MNPTIDRDSILIATFGWDVCPECGTALDPRRDFDNHRCVPPKCVCWNPAAPGHQLDCPLRLTYQGTIRE